MTIAPVEISGRACILLTLRDLTHQRELEAQLAHAQKLDAIGSLAGGVAHDFNNMLGVIQGFTEKLQHELAGRGKAELEGIRKAVQRSADLVEQLLAFSRQRVLQPTLLDLNEVLTETDAMLGRLVGENIAIEVRTTQEIEAVEVDRSLAELAIVNLVLNARDAMSNGGRLEITAQRVVLDPAKAEELEVEAGNFIQLDIVDDGEGMDAKLQSQAMEPFFTTKGNGTGTGLGLTMVERFARQSGGALTLTSHVGEGTRVSLLLPRVEGRVPVAAQPASASPETASRSGTILLVEDEEMLRRLAANALTEAGHHVIEAANGIEALERMDAFPDTIDILVTDAVMPKMGGGQLAERVRALRPQVRAIFTSGYTDQMMDLQPYDQFLAKPFLMSLLCQRVGEILAEPKPVDRSSAG
jgi:two-component system cell cycle sensor histidine kinase/response regulator CckA